jgi:hypothetical protein
MALGSTQPLAEIRNGKLLGGLKQTDRKAVNLIIIIIIIIIIREPVV